MAELGLAGDGSPLPRRDRPSCGAQTRKGAPCLARVVPANDVVAYTVGSQPDLQRPRARRASRWCSAGGGPSGARRSRLGRECPTAPVAREWDIGTGSRS
jgi:hypothetical protein